MPVARLPKFYAHKCGRSGEGVTQDWNHFQSSVLRGVSDRMSRGDQWQVIHTPDPFTVHTHGCGSFAEFR